jgi:hypothetical protein
MDIGTLVYIRKGKKYCGKSNITNKALYRVNYGVYFYKEGENIIGYLADDKPFTFSKGFDKKSDMDKFLKLYNHEI